MTTIAVPAGEKGRLTDYNTLIHVLPFLDKKSLGNSESVCKLFKDAIDKDGEKLYLPKIKDRGCFPAYGYISNKQICIAETKVENAQAAAAREKKIQIALAFLYFAGTVMLFAAGAALIAAVPGIGIMAVGVAGVLGPVFFVGGAVLLILGIVYCLINC